MYSLRRTLEHVDLLNAGDRLHANLLQGLLELLVINAAGSLGLVDLLAARSALASVFAVSGLVVARGAMACLEHLPCRSSVSQRFWYEPAEFVCDRGSAYQYGCSVAEALPASPRRRAWLRFE